MNDDLNDVLRNEIYSRMDLKETDELIDIWQRHNPKEWTDLAFKVVEEILRDRLGEVPSQRFEKHKMTAEFEKDYLPIWCEDCDSQGYVFVDDLDCPYYVVCKTCGYETSQVWCPKCQMGGEFVRNIGERPSSWNCSNCKTEYELPSEFYENPIMLFTEEVLPQNVLERIEKDFQTANTPWRDFLAVIAAILAVIGLMAVGLLPMLLVFTPLPWTIPGFIMTLLAFAVWWWIIGKVLKSMRDTREGSVRQSS